MATLVDLGDARRFREFLAAFGYVCPAFRATSLSLAVAISVYSRSTTRATNLALLPYGIHSLISFSPVQARS